jgi:hypothetical protein
MSDLIALFHVIDLRLGLDEALALRRVGRARRSARSRKGWITRRDRDGTATAAANGDLPVPKDCQARASEGGIAQ